MGRSLSQWEIRPIYAVPVKKMWKNFAPVTFRWTEISQSNFSPVSVKSFKKNYPGEIQFDQIISVNCPSGKYCCNNRPSRFFFLWTCPSRFFCPKSVPVNFTGQILSQSNYPAQNLIPVDINLVLVKNDLK